MSRLELSRGLVVGLIVLSQTRCGADGESTSSWDTETTTSATTSETGAGPGTSESDASGDSTGDSAVTSTGDSDPTGSTSLEDPGIRVDTGTRHTCAVADDGRVWCWGAGNFGVLGYGNWDFIGDDELPSDVGPVDVGGHVVQLSAGEFTTCAVLDDGDVRCWGHGEHGWLGHGLSTGLPCETPDPPFCENDPICCIGDDEPPSAADPVSLGGSAIQVSVGRLHTCALLSSGDVLCWGSGGARLGYGHAENVGDDELPSDVGPIDLGGKAVQISAGASHTCAVLEDRTLRCWGSGGRGVLGYGNTFDIGDDEPPSAVGPVAVGGPVIEVAVGGPGTCALLEGGDVRCWGPDNFSALGPDTCLYVDGEDVLFSCAVDPACCIGDDELPLDAAPVELGGKAVHIAAESVACALLESGAARCWGHGQWGILGYGNEGSVGDDELPRDVGPLTLGGAALQIAGGGLHNCAVTEGDLVRCWGYNIYGMLGYGHTQTIGDNPGEMPPPPVQIE